MLNAVQDLSKGVHAAIAVGDAIDFCVWVLEQDGLRVSPFDQHPDGDGSLRARGMTAETWLDWTKKTALLLDQRLCEQPDVIERRAGVIEQYEQCKALSTAQEPHAFLPQFEHAQLLEQFDRQHQWQLAQREKIAAIVKQVYGEATPPDAWDDEIAVWNGNPAVAERLYELQQAYPFQEREQLWLDFNVGADGRIGGPIEVIVDLGTAYEWVQSELAEYDGAEIHLVAYPYPVEMAMLPGALVLSQSSERRNQQLFDDRVKKAIHQLILLHHAEETEQRSFETDS